MRVSGLLQDDSEALLNRVVLGDELALRELHGLLAPGAFAIALRVLGDPCDAEEVLQETFFEIWRTATRFNPARTTVGRWVATLALSRAIDRLRKRRSLNRMRAALALQPAVNVPSPDDLLISAQIARQVRKGLGELSPGQRCALELAYFAGLSQREIAANTSTPLGTVKTRIRAGMLMLAQRLPPVP